jgi:hypothetical protein
MDSDRIAAMVRGASPMEEKRAHAKGYLEDEQRSFLVEWNMICARTTSLAGQPRLVLEAG